MPSVLALVAEVSKGRASGQPSPRRARITASPWLLATGSKARIAYLREIAVKRNMTLEVRLIPRRQGRRGGERRGDLQGARDAAGCRQNLAKDGTRPPARFPANYPGLSPSRILRAIRHAHTHRATTSIRWRRWQRQCLPADPSILTSRITRSPRIMRAVSARTEAWRSRASRRVVRLNRRGRFARGSGRSNLPGVAHPGVFTPGADMLAPSADPMRASPFDAKSRSRRDLQGAATA
jgi:hypothetical protein